MAKSFSLKCAQRFAMRKGVNYYFKSIFSVHSVVNCKIWDKNKKEERMFWLFSFPHFVSLIQALLFGLFCIFLISVKNFLKGRVVNGKPYQLVFNLKG